MVPKSPPQQNATRKRSCGNHSAAPLCVVCTCWYECSRCLSVAWPPEACRWSHSETRIKVTVKPWNRMHCQFFLITSFQTNNWIYSKNDLVVRTAIYITKRRVKH